MTGNCGKPKDDKDAIFGQTYRLFGVANARINENSNAALGAQNRGGLSGTNLIALQASGGNAGGGVGEGKKAAGFAPTVLKISVMRPKR